MENQNSVAFIAKINKISLIEGADKIQLAQIEGWTSIVQKDIHKEGDLILCITTDAVIPEELAIKWGVDKYLRKGFRVRTIKLKGVYSECILIPLKDVGDQPSEFSVKAKEGYDAMEILKIHKYEPPINTHTGLGTGAKKYRYHTNPNFHIYHKFPNQKNTPNMFNEEDVVVITRKIHGTNARYGIVKKTSLSFLDNIKKVLYKFIRFMPESWNWIEYDFVYGSHNVEKGSESQGFYSTDVWKEVMTKYFIKDKLWKFAKQLGKETLGSGITIYGEIYGPGIQGEKYSYGLTEKAIALFDITINNEYIDNSTFFAAVLLLNLPMVEVLHLGNWNKEVQDKFNLNSFIEGTKIPHEGIVVKSITGKRDKVSKVINPDYLIFAEKHVVPDSH